MTDKSNVVKNSASIAKEVEQLDEDSSYDSDTEIVSSPHQNVSRNVSETLALELFEDFNSTSYRQYQTYLEFALKLGYSERLVQSALNRLGNPTNNELLAELIKLGAQPGSNACDFGADIKSSEIGDECVTSEQDVLRPIVIDGSNVAMGHGNKEVFSCRGIAICVDWFRQRGHKDITVFVPKWRKESARPDNPIKDQEILNELEKERILVYTPSRSLTNGKRMVCYDDRYILKLAVDNDGVVVSNDNYRDLLQESNEFKKVVEERILMYSFVNDRFMPPDDPLGKLGPTLDNFLKFQPKKSDQQICPYGAKKKCTYGNKCKFFHPERGSQPHKSVTEKLSDFANYHLQARNSDAIKKQVQGKSLSVPLNNNNNANIPASSSGENFHRKQTLCRTTSNVLNSMPSQQQQQLQSQQHLVPPNLQLGQHHVQHQYLRPGQQALSASTSPTNNMMPHSHQQQHQQQFPKSHSIENLPREMYQPVNYSNSNLWNQGQQPDQSNQHGSQLDSQDMSLNLNLHKKLQRQLSLLNPFDPRLYPMQRYHNLPSHMGQGNPNPEHFQLSSPPAHKPLSTSHSLTGGATQGQNQTHPIYEHQNVMRIASAPNSSNNWTNNSANNHNHLPSSSASEPHINWPIADQRRRLHYHLCNIFPKKDVEQAMSMFPDEANPQKICSAILNIQSLRQ